MTVFLPNPSQPSSEGLNRPASDDAATVFLPAPGANRISGGLGKPTEGASAKNNPNTFAQIGGPARGHTRSWNQRSASWQSLRTGDVLAERYEILSLLGEGGMGAVYKAVDRELDREVAVKLIRPELASQADILDRFKQEVILARQITHYNVIRIYDLGSDGPLKFLTMEFVEGVDLKHYLAKNKPDIIEVAGLFRQICDGLMVAHATNVVHRDLKPQNVMIAPDGRAAVMDFGLALAIEKKGTTQSGGILGTPDYMSPEQAVGETLDQRSDIFSLGLMLYEMLTQTIPFTADTMLATLAARTKGPAPPPISVNPAIPLALNNIVCKCIEIDREARYQSVTQVLEDLDAWEESVPGSRANQKTAKARAQAVAAMQPRLRRTYWAAGIATVLMLAAGGYFVYSGGRRAGPTSPVKLLIADFDNNSGERVFDRTVEPLFGVALEGASFITSMNREQARKLGKELQPNSAFDEGVARLVAVREGFDVVLSGAIDKSSDGFTLRTRALEAVTGKLLAENKETVKTKEEVLSSVRKLAAPVRRSLGDVTPESAQMIAGETYTASSMEAAHSYAVGQEQQYAGNFDEALRYYLSAVQLDPSFGRAYAGIAVVQRNLGRKQEAIENYKIALDRIERMSERERYRTRGGYYVTIGQPEKAVEEFQALVNKYPADTAGHANLAVAYLSLRKIPKALEEGRKAIEIYPKNVSQRNNVAMFALYAGDYSMAIREAQETLKLNPSYAKAFVTLALAQLALGRADQASATYERLRALNALGASRAATGLSDLALLEGKATAAVDSLLKGIAEDEKAKNAAAAASKRILLGLAYLALEDPNRAAQVAERALKDSGEIDIRMLGGVILARSKQPEKALAVAVGLEQSPDKMQQARGKVVRGEALTAGKRFLEAAAVLQESIPMLDLWSAHFALGRALLGAGDFAKAEQQFEICEKRGGETAALILDEVPTYSLLPPVYYYLGRAQEGANKPQAAESYAKFVAFRPEGTDPMTSDAKSKVKR